MKNKVIIFDLDGVLFDSIAISEQYFFDVYPGSTKEMVRDLLSGNYHDEIQKITIPKKQETEVEKNLRRQIHAENKSKSPMYPGSKELLEQLHQDHYILALNTSAYERNCLPLLERNNILHLFDFLGTAELSTSKVEKFKMIKEKYNLDTSNLLFITDTLGDIRESDIAHIPTIAVTWGVHDRDYFAREEHSNLIAIIDSFAELHTLIYNS